MTGYLSTWPVTDKIIEIVRERLTRRGIDRTILPDDDLSEKGLDSLDMVHVMLRVEAEYDLQIPETHMTGENFRSSATIGQLITGLLSKAPGRLDETIGAARFSNTTPTEQQRA